ncbi:O-antigen ligase family protein [Enterovibrio paralichthyis]|uniref:O-antigen ligase family protein n=1 Tax=Enterovibrio paralichthyis TaxID=2853805 RepID=UPI001C491CFD|nr:O-antigen ligase family protein [Enterovibrio paralichthyis]MBV7298649.1 O-antigen ligase family protein [Enterovibrio paralichthyis]
MTVAQPLPAPNRTVKKFAESLFLLSPLIVMLFSIFNFVDTKWTLSRLIPLVCIYCIFRYKGAMKTNWHTPSLKPLMTSSLVVALYFSITHVLRGDEFGFSRTLFTCLFYILLVPWRQVPSTLMTYILLFAAVFCGLNAGYEYFVMGLSRVGIATNPIPYALYCAMLCIISLYYLLIAQSLAIRSIAGIGVVFSTAALMMTGVRGVLLFLPAVIFYLTVRLLPASKRYYSLTLMIVGALSVGGYWGFKDTIDSRLQQTVKELQSTSSGNKNNSIGVRLDLWKTALSASESHAIFGYGDLALRETIAKLPNPSAALQPHTHNQFLDTLARSGLVGLALLLAWILSPLLRISSLNKAQLALTPLVSSLVLMVLLAGLTDVPFHHTHLVYLYTLLMTMILVLAEPENNLEISKNGV